MGINNYNIICRKDRKDTNKGIGGGLLIYAKTSLGACEFESEEMKDFNQCCGIKFKSTAHSYIHLFLIYRPHNLYNGENVTENNYNLLKAIKNSPKQSVLIGDFNYSDIDWKNRTASAKISKDFLELVEDKFLKQCIDFPTHNSGKTLDLVLTQGELVISCENLGKLGSSAHRMILTHIRGEVPTKNKTSYFSDWKNADIVSLKEFLCNINWQEKLHNMDIEEAWNLFKNKLSECMDKFVPQKVKKLNNQPPWMNRDFLQLIRKKRRVWKRYNKYSSMEDKTEYENMERQVKNQIRNTKKNYERRLAREIKNNPKLFYNYINSKKSNRVAVGPLKHEGKLVTDCEEICDKLGNHFGSVFTKEENSDGNINIEDLTDQIIDDVLITVNDVKEKLKKLKPFSSAGPDNIRTRILIIASDEVAAPLQMIFQKSLDTGILPKDWKNANIVPVFKKGSRFEAGNYRPISLTSVICKVMESVLKDRIVNHLDTNKLIHSSQHGFMKKKSCLTNLLEYLETILTNIDEGDSVDVIYLDFAKAFDKVSHKHLAKVLEAHSIKGKILQWIISWLNDRSQRVYYNNKSSAWKPVWSGGPRVSALGPLCFVIYINILDLVIKDAQTFLSKFADDSKAGRKVNTDKDREALQCSLNALTQWAQDWKMEFNESKCKVLHIGKNNPRYGYQMNGVNLEVSDKEKDVGVMIQEDLKPSKQCATAAAKANSILGQMARSFSYRNKTVWISVRS